MNNTIIGYCMKSLYLIMSTERFKKASRAAPFNIPFCNKARSMS